MRRSAHFWPLARPARALALTRAFPPVSAFAHVFDTDPPVRFVSASPPRPRGAVIDAQALYDARITLDGEVPTRAACWHDLMNALVWGAFPRSKRALHARQHRAIFRRIVAGATRLPPTRTPELDALALFDEGGVVVSCRQPGACARGDDRCAPAAVETVVFGHAIYESLALGLAPAIVAGISLCIHLRPLTNERAFDEQQDRRTGLVRALDGALAAVIEDEARLQSPHELARVRL